MPSRPWRLALQGVHPGPEVSPPLLSDSDLGLGDCSGVLSEGVQEDDQVPRPSVKHPEQFAPVVASEFSQLSAHLGAVRKGKVRVGRRQHVQTVDLVVDLAACRRAGRSFMTVDREPELAVTACGTPSNSRPWTIGSSAHHSTSASAEPRGQESEVISHGHEKRIVEPLETVDVHFCNVNAVIGLDWRLIPSIADLRPGDPPRLGHEGGVRLAHTGRLDADHRLVRLETALNLAQLPADPNALGRRVVSPPTANDVRELPVRDTGLERSGEELPLAVLPCSASRDPQAPRARRRPPRTPRRPSTEGAMDPR